MAVADEAGMELAGRNQALVEVDQLLVDANLLRNTTGILPRERYSVSMPMVDEAHMFDVLKATYFAEVEGTSNVPSERSALKGRFDEC